MSFGEEWMLPKPVDAFGNDEILRHLRAFLMPSVEVTIRGEPSDRSIGVVFTRERIADIANALRERGELDWDWEGDLDAPRDDGDRYECFIDLVDDEGSKIRIDSNDGDNREAWPIVFAIASALSVDLDALIEQGPQLDSSKMN